MALEVGLYTRKPVTVTPFGVDCGVYTPPEKKPLSSSIVIGTVKKLDHPYGIDALLRAFARLVQRNPGVSLELRIVGEGPLRSDLERLACGLGVSCLVTFYGRAEQGEVPALLNELDIFAALSVNESFGVSALEASACGLPLVVTDAGGLPEVVRHRETGFVVPVGGVVEAASAMERLVLDRGLRNKMGRAGREFVLAHFQWAHTARVMEEVYEGICAKRS